MDKIEEYIQANKLEQALDLCLEKLESDAENVELLMLSARIYQKQGVSIKAMNAYLKVLKIEPENTVAKTSLQMIKGILDYYCKDMINP